MLALEPSALRQGAMVFAIGLALYAQLAVHQRSDDLNGWVTFGLAALLAAVVAGGGAVGMAPAVLAPPAQRGRVVRALCGALAVAAIAATTYLSSLQHRPVLALLCWLGAPLIATLAVRGWRIAPPRRAALPWTARELGILAAIVVLAALARTLWIDSFPRAFFGDEPRVGMYLVNQFREASVRSFFSMGWNTWPVVGLSLQGLFAPLFGIHIWTLRLSSALMGTLGVVTTYLLARELYAPRTALVAAFLFAVCRTAIDFSRLGITHAQVLCLEPLAFFCVWRALNGGSAVAYLWAGVTTAWCLFSYNAGQLVPPLVFGWLALGALLRPARLRTHAAGATLLVAAFALTLFPYLYYFTDAFTFGPNWGQWTIMARNRQTLGEVLDTWQSVGWEPAWAILWRQIRVTWLGFGVLPGGGYSIGYRRGGMLDDVSAALFVLGLAMTIRRLRRGSDAFVFYWWIGTVLAGGIATIDPPSFVRMVGLLPAVALLAAQPIGWLLQPRPGGDGAPPSTVLAEATNGFDRALYRIAALVALALLGAAAWQNYHTYFVELADTRGDPISELARYMETLPPDHHAALLGAEHYLQFRGELFLIEFPNRVQDVPEPAHFLPLHEPMTAPLALVLGPTQMTLTEYVRSLYPDAAVGQPERLNDEPMFQTVVLTPEAVLPHTGLGLTVQRPDGPARELGSSDPFAEQVDAPGAEHLAWRGSVYWPTHRAVQVNIDAGQPTTVTIGDAPPITTNGTDRTSATVTLPRGWQPIRIDETATPRRRLAIALDGMVNPLLTRWSLRPTSTPQGLTATYRRTDGTVINAVDPQLNAFAVEDRFAGGSGLIARMPFRATWRGALRIDTPGSYEFDAISSGPFTVQLDGTELFAAVPAVPEQPVLAKQARTLAPGLHPIEVELNSTIPAHTTRRIFQLFWTPPGGVRQLIPPGSFVPG